MMNSTMRPILSLIDSKILTRAQNIQSLTTSLHSRLPSNLRQHCWVVDITDQTLVILTNNAERATILRYQQHELLKQINEEFGQTMTKPVRRVKVKVDYHLSKLSAHDNNPPARTIDALHLARESCRNMMKLLD